jgi:hypothetical protein
MTAMKAMTAMPPGGTGEVGRPPRPRRSPAAAVVVCGLALLLAACSVSTSGDDAATTSAPAGSAGATTEVRGVTDDTIKLGVALIDFDEVKQKFGVDLGHIPDGFAEALAAQVNEAGGIDGRHVEVVVREFMPVGTDSSEQACRELIEDEQVYAVLGSFLGDSGLCVTETHATPYFAAFGLTDERQQRSHAPFLSVEGDALGASIQKVIDTGVLDGRHVAIYSESDADPQQVTAKVVEPLETAGIDVVSQAQLPASGDAVQAGNDIDTIFQRFQADGADALVSVSGAAVLLPALGRTSWQPQLVFTNGQFTADGGLANLGLTDFSDLDGAVAVSMSLLSDDLVGDQQLADCLDAVNTHTGSDYTIDDIYDPKVKPGSRQIGSVPGLCQVWDMTLAVLEHAGDDLAPAALTASLDSLGPFPLPGYAAAELSSTRWGAVDTVRTWHFDESKQGFVPDTDG